MAALRSGRPAGRDRPAIVEAVFPAESAIARDGGAALLQRHEVAVCPAATASTAILPAPPVRVGLRRRGSRQDEQREQSSESDAHRISPWAAAVWPAFIRNNTGLGAQFGRSRQIERLL